MDVHNLDREAGKIFVTGGSGIIGNRIVTKLMNTGYAHVRLGTSNTESLDYMTDKGAAEVVEFSWKREETFANALHGIKSVIITIPYEQHWYKNFAKFLKACKIANVKHFVKLSFYLSHVNGLRHIPFVKNHLHCDEILMRLIMPDEEYLSQMSYTILSASHFMSNQTVNYGVELNGTDASKNMYSATKNRAANYISPNDIAEATVRVVLSPQDHYNRIYTLLGPELITCLGVTQYMSKFYGKKLHHTDVSFAKYRNILIEAGVAWWEVNERMAMQRVTASGLEENITWCMRNDFHQICCHRPESFAEYLTNIKSMTPMELGQSTKHFMFV